MHKKGFVLAVVAFFFARAAMADGYFIVAPHQEHAKVRRLVLEPKPYKGAERRNAAQAPVGASPTTALSGKPIFLDNPQYTSSSSTSTGQDPQSFISGIGDRGLYPAALTDTMSSTLKITDALSAGVNFQSTPMQQIESVNVKIDPVPNVTITTSFDRRVYDSNSVPVGGLMGTLSTPGFGFSDEAVLVDYHVPIGFGSAQ